MTWIHVAIAALDLAALVAIVSVAKPVWVELRKAFGPELRKCRVCDSEFAPLLEQEMCSECVKNTLGMRKWTEWSR